MMTTKRPDVGDKDQFNVMAACRVLRIDRKTLARYDARGYINSMVRMGRKVYSGAQIKKCYDTVTLI